MNKKRIVIISGIVLIVVINAFFISSYINSPDSFNQILGGVLSNPVNSNPFCEHYGGENLTEPGTCISKDSGEVSDYCEGNVLHKASCLNNECELKNYDCREYCNGLCLRDAMNRGYCACPA